MANLIATARRGIARNFGGSETSYFTFLGLFKKQLVALKYDKKLTDFDETEKPDVPSLINENLISVFRIDPA